MRVFADDLSRTIRVQWYFVPATNRVVPHLTPFGPRSDFWHQPIIGDVLGEDPMSFRRHPAGQIRRGPGVSICGNERQWTQGASVSDPVKAINVRTGLPCCCGPAPLLAVGGGVGGGQGVDNNFILQDDGFLILQDDGSRMIWT